MLLKEDSKSKGEGYKMRATKAYCLEMTAPTETEKS